MSRKNLHNLRDLSPGSYNWNIKVRIIRSWRGHGFKGLNVLLLDDKNDRMHAFVPGNIIDTHESKFVDGNICTMSNFSVKDYRSEGKFRCINSEKQIIFTTYTEVVQLDEDETMIAKNMLDFYDLTDLGDIANKNLFLTDVIGVVEKDFPISNLTNRLGQQQKQVKFNIVDERCSVNVTFWDSLAEEFDLAINYIIEYPAIIIIASAKITSWQGSKQNKPQIEISNVTATRFYLNYDDPNVVHLRRMLPSPLFSKYDFFDNINNISQILPVTQIKGLGIDYIQKEVICNIKVKSVLEKISWYYYDYPSCYKEIEPADGFLKCYRCSDRNVPHPYKRWRLNIEAEDQTGNIGIVLSDRDCRTVIGMDAEEFGGEKSDEETLPDVAKEIENRYFIIKLILKTGNIGNQDSLYYSFGIYEVFTEDNVSNMESTRTTNTMEFSMTQASGSCHLDDFSQLNFQSPQSSRKS